MSRAAARHAALRGRRHRRRPGRVWRSATTSPRRAADFTILEAAAEPAAALAERWDSLVLFTPVRYDSLPGLPFPGDPDSYPARDDVVAYLDGLRAALRAAGRAGQPRHGRPRERTTASSSRSPTGPTRPTRW